MTTSYWLSEPTAPFPSVNVDDPDVVVVGAGVTGCAAALRLAQAGKRVRLVDEREVAGGASGRNGGFALRGMPAAFDVTAESVGQDTASELMTWTERAIDTIEIAKSRIPGARYSLDELCRRFNIDLAARTKHGALLDAELTAQVYLELIGGRQKRLSLAPNDAESSGIVTEIRAARVRPEPLPSRLTAEEATAHLAFVAKELGANALWSQAA